MQVANEVRDEDHAGHAHVEVLGERFNLLYNIQHHRRWI